MSWDTLSSTLCRLSYKKYSYDKYPGQLAIFDLDDTLVKTRQGKKFPQSSQDWMWCDSVLDKLKELAGKDYAIIIVTNQAGAEKNLERREMILERISLIFNELVDTCQPRLLEAYVALGRDIYRKPNTTIFEKYVWTQLQTDEVTLERIFYVGDAAGRTDDFSDSDRKFAYNLHLLLKYLGLNKNVSFFTPEEYFSKLSATPRFWSGFDPRSYYDKAKEREKIEIEKLIESDCPSILIFLVGPPASGKSTLARKIKKNSRCSNRK